jgi:hypothetical protein
MSFGLSILWIAVGVIVVVWGLTSDTAWFKWFLIMAGALTIILQGIVLVRRWTSGN